MRRVLKRWRQFMVDLVCKKKLRRRTKDPSIESRTNETSPIIHRGWDLKPVFEGWWSSLGSGTRAPPENDKTNKTWRLILVAAFKVQNSKLRTWYSISMEITHKSEHPKETTLLWDSICNPFRISSFDRFSSSVRWSVSPVPPKSKF